MAILTKGVSLSEFAHMSEQEQLKRVGELAKALRNPTTQKIEAQKKELDEEIRVFESRYKMTSDEMLSSLREGKLTETADICSWTFVIKLRKRLDSQSSARSSRAQSST